MKYRKQFIGVNSIRFHNRFNSEKDRYRYFADIKWQERYI